MNRTFPNLPLAIVAVVMLLMTIGCSGGSGEPKTEEVLKEKVALLQDELKSQKKKIETLNKEHQDKITKLKAEYEDEIQRIKNTLGDNVDEQKKQHDEQIASLKKYHKDELEQKVADFNDQIASLKDKVVSLEKSRHIDKATEDMMTRLPSHYQKQIAIIVTVFIVMTLSLGAVLGIFIFKYNSLKSQLLATLNTNLQEANHG